ncbi:DUF6522 family protein [Polymorphobacter sp.]|uniref:DUF6522 family protein n=1 Tax=Polymorphobacter sp. TaxID=1909290 RepID=UPI003F70B669
MQIDRDAEGFTVPAELLADALRLDAAEVSARLRSGAITSLCEQGQGEDEGRWRLSFTFGQRRLRLVVDSAGALINRSVVDFGTPNA